MVFSKKVAIFDNPLVFAKLLATRKPTQNTGKRTAGVDGETWSSPETKMKAALSLTEKKVCSKAIKESIY